MYSKLVDIYYDNNNINTGVQKIKMNENQITFILTEQISHILQRNMHRSYTIL